MKTLLEQSPSSESLKELWAHLLEEERMLHRRFQVHNTPELERCSSKSTAPT